MPKPKVPSASSSDRDDPHLAEAGAIKKKAPVSSQDDPGSVKRAVIAGILGIVVLIFAGIASFQSNLVAYIWPVIMVGLAMVAAAAGSQANVQQPGWAAAGAAAIVVIFAYVLKPDPRPHYVMGKLKDSQSFREIQIYTDNALLVGRPSVHEAFRFIAFDNDLRGKYFYLVATPMEGQEFSIGCLPMSLFLRPDDAGPLDLSLVQKDDAWWIRNNESAPGSLLGKFGRSGCPEESGGSLTKSNGSTPWRVALNALGITSAHAAELSRVAASKAIKDLRSPATDVRNATRQTLIDQRDPGSLEAIVASWNVEQSSVDTDYGLIVAWVNAIHFDGSVASVLSHSLSEPQRARIVALMGYSDIAVRYSATELMTWLLRGASTTDIATSDHVLASVITLFTDEPTRTRLIGNSERYDTKKWFVNASRALVGSRCQLRPEQRRSVAAELHEASTRASDPGLASVTDVLVKAAVRLESPCGSPT